MIGLLGERSEEAMGRGEIDWEFDRDMIYEKYRSIVEQLE
jgi:hypothetical protein